MIPLSPSRTETLRAYVQHYRTCKSHRCAECDVRYLTHGLTHGSKPLHPFRAKACTCGLDAALSALAGPQEPQEEVRVDISELRAGEEGDGPLESTDLFIRGRGISLLCNVLAGQSFTFSLGVDDENRHSGTVGSPFPASPSASTEPK